MIQRLIVIVLLCITTISSAQETTSSPYSYFGVGSLNFKGSVESRSMGGISMFSDSIHLNLQNPSGLAQLKLVAFTLGGINQFTKQATDYQNSKNSSVAVNYLAVGIPMGEKFGASFGLLPLTSVGYDIENLQDGSLLRNTGEGGLNKVFLSFAYAINSNLSLGVDANYNFGNIINETILDTDEAEYGTRETNSSNLSGFSVNFGATYRKMLTDNLELFSSITYTPEMKLNSENSREIASVLLTDFGTLIDVDVRNIEVFDSNLYQPSEFTFGAGIGKPRKWFVGAEYTTKNASSFTSRTSNLDNVSFDSSSTYKLGGFYTPRYNSLSSYFNKITYRAGVRYEDTGLIVNNQNINEFGISFGVGLPVGRMFSNFNIGFEVGSRGTKNNGLVNENFFNTIISLSLNDRWFIKTLYD